MSLKNGICSFALKLARIVLIANSTSKNSCYFKNYSPIGVINNFSKGFEMAVNVPLYFHIKPLIFKTSMVSWKIYPPQPICFIYNTIQCLRHGQSPSSRCIAYWLLQGIWWIGEFDYTEKNFGFGSKPTSFFQFDLVDLMQYVDCCGFNSCEFLTTSGLPQRSVLGPPFCIFI